MRRYVLGNRQSEYGFRQLWFLYKTNFTYTPLLVGLYKWINDIYGATLPVLKNEIEDFFFTRLGTGTIHSTWRYVLRNAQSEYEFIN